MTREELLEALTVERFAPPLNPQISDGRLVGPGPTKAWAEAAVPVADVIELGVA